MALLPQIIRQAVLFLLLFILHHTLQAQHIKNPSFEGFRGGGQIPQGWENCGGPLSTPDTQPGAWDVWLPPADGMTYLGLVFRERDNGSFESVTQTLNYPFHKDSCYTFEISLAFDPDYEDKNSRKPGILRIWGGNGSCATTENIWTSPVVDHKEWRTYTVRFSPKETYTSIKLEGYHAQLPAYSGDILIDNIRNITASAKPTLFLGNTITVCDQPDYVIDASIANGPYRWQDGSTASTFRVTKSGIYSVEASVGGCRTTGTVHVIIGTPFELDLGADLRLCEGEKATFSLNIPSAKYRWSNGATISAITVTEPGTYWVEAMVGNCIKTDTVEVAVGSCRFVIPNIITPNGDNLNDTFTITDGREGSWKLEVYDRWGKQVYSAKEYRNNWSAVGVRDGVYFYMLTNNTTGETYKGPLTIIR